VDHIISKFNWDTTFNRKEQAPELQQRLSNWSNINMPREIAGIFDSICPSGQIWKIQSLELDLGDIDFNNLEFELAANMRNKLREKLIQLVLYSYRNHNDIQIVNENESPVYLISSFLLTGLMPWNYKTADGSYNSLLTYQLQNNRQALIIMLREIGVTHENVRKRMAWQTNEPNIRKIIEGLEPSNNEQIIDFTDEFLKIQIKKTVVQTNATDFKKNLWLWVLNYLFTERGSVFNKLAYMRSSIRQMAGHYNIAYNELLTLIEGAVTEIRKSYDVKADFILSLLILVEENKLSIPKSGAVVTSIDNDWLFLQAYFKSHATNISDKQKKEFNELVVSLYRRDSPRLTRFLQLLGKSNSLWLQVAANLNDASLECVFSALSNSSAPVLVKSIYFIDQLNKLLGLSIERKQIWQTGLKFLLRNKGTALNSKEFLSYSIATLSKRNGLSKMDMLDRLTGADIPVTFKTADSLLVYGDLKAVFAAEISKNYTASFPDHFTQMIDRLSDLVLSRTADPAYFAFLKKIFVKYVQINPVVALTALMQYPDKNKLKQLIPYLLNSYMVSWLLANSSNANAAILLSVNRLLTRPKSGKKSPYANILHCNDLMLAGLNIIIEYSAINPEKFAERLLDHMSTHLTMSQAQPFYLFITALRADTKLSTLDIPEGVFSCAQEKLLLQSKLSVTQKAYYLMELTEANKIAVSRLLAENFKDREFTTLRIDKGRESKAIIEYLLPNGDQLMGDLIKQYTGLLTLRLKQTAENKIMARLITIYWQCLINYNSHNGKAGAMKKAFQIAVLFNFPAGKNNGRAVGLSVFLTNTKTYRLKSGNTLTAQQLLWLIESCLANGIDTIVHEQSKLHFNQLVNTCLELNAEGLRQIISAIPVSEKRIALMISSVSFSRFGRLIMSDGNRLLAMAMESIVALFELVGAIVSSAVANDCLHYYWHQAWHLIKTNTWTAQNLNDLVKHSLSFISHQKDVNAELIISICKEKDIWLNAMLERAMARCFLSFTANPLNDLRKSPAKQLQKLHSKGLLNEFVSYLLHNKQTPGWFGIVTQQEVKDLLNEIVRFYPVALFRVLKTQVIAEAQVYWLCQAVSFKEFIRSAGFLNRSRQSLLNIVYEFYVALGTISAPGISARNLQDMLFRKILKAYLSDNWKNISTENIWNELIWDLNNKQGIAPKQFLGDVEKVRVNLPPALQISFDQLSRSDTFIEPVTKAAANKVSGRVFPAMQKKEARHTNKQSIFVRNAGLVLLNNYIPHLFKHLDMLTEAGQFSDNDVRADAVHYLQYAVSGLTSTGESLLPLNKILCGMMLSSPIKESVDISEKVKKIIDGLINAAIKHWPQIGTCSIDGFRGNWLVRDGLLTEQNDRWDLTVEKRAYDLLINKSPFSFSIIKHPWMLKPIYVTWPY